MQSSPYGSFPKTPTEPPFWEESFVDFDLDLTDLGGPLSWTEALDDAQVGHATARTLLAPLNGGVYGLRAEMAGRRRV